jgi:hypothetical protein
LFSQCRSKLQCCGIDRNLVWITVESSLFVGDQCSWISWVTLTHKFTSPQTCFYLSPTDKVEGDFRLALCLSVHLSVSPVNQFSALFLFALSDIHLIFGILLCHTKIQIKFEFGFDPLIFHEVMALGLRKMSWIISFLYFFHSCFQIFICYLVYCFAIPIYISYVWVWFQSIDFSRSYGPWT